MAARDLNPTCEDHWSDDEHQPAPPEALRRSPAANVAAKRSYHSDLGTEKPAMEKVVNIDLQSDSGYSSHTAATMSSSADSAVSAKTSSASTASTAPSSAASYPPSSPVTARRRPTLDPGDRKSSSQSSPRKPLQRTGSVASKRPSISRKAPPPPPPSQPQSEDCTNPNCTDCVPNARSSRGRRPQPSALDSALDISYPPFDQRSQRSDPATSYTSPPSPTYSRQPTPYTQGAALIQPAQTRRRPSSAAPRPMSYCEGTSYWPAGMPTPYQNPAQDHGPPPAMSAHFNMHHPQQMAPYGMGAMQTNYYSQAQSMAQTSPPYEQQRPSLSARGSANSNSYQTRRQSGFMPTTLVTQDRNEQPMPSARFHDAPRSGRQERFPPTHSDSESSGYSSSEGEEQHPIRNDRALMPPPKIKRSKDKERRPSLRHANTTQVYNERNERRLSMIGMSQSSTLPERPKERDPRSRVSTAQPSRAPSMSRPALVQHKAQSAFETPRPAKVVVENSKSRRRQSYQPGHDREYMIEQKRRNRDSKIYRDDLEDQYDREDAILVSERPRPRADTATSIGRRTEYAVESKQRRAAMDAESYQQRTRGTYDPLADTVHRAAKRASRVPSGPSDAGSNRSDDRKTRVSQARTTVTNGGANGEIRLRVDASAPLSLQFNGDMEGRTLQIVPAEQGMADIVIGNSRGDENVYRSDKSSVVPTRKALVAGSARRELEEASQYSGRSSQSRRERERDAERDRERRPLRRRQTEYN
jgi:hypothetical protein